MRHNVTTPGGFFVGVGGIAAFCIVSSIVFLWVKSPSASTELRPQQVALGLVPNPGSKDKGANETIEGETMKLLAKAAATYNAGRKPDLDNLGDLRGVVRFRQARKIAAEHANALNAPSNVSGKSVIEAAMDEVAAEIAAKKPVPSKVALMEIAPDPKLPPSLPNYSGGGSKTVNFENPAKPVTPAPTPAAPAAPAPSAPEPSRPPLINSPEPK